MSRALRLSATSVAALALAMAPVQGPTLLSHWLGETSAYAAGNSGSHGNSGGHSNASNGNSSSNGSSGSGSANSSNGNGHQVARGDNKTHENIAALAGFGNAAHASVQGLLHANPHSAVGRLRTYADLQFAARQLQATVTTEQAKVLADQAAVTSAQAAYDQLAAADKALTDQGLTLTTEQQDALTAAQDALTTAQNTLDAAQTSLATDQAALASATTKANTALAVATKNSENPAVQSYIDTLLQKYYTYLATL